MSRTYVGHNMSLVLSQNTTKLPTNQKQVLSKVNKRPPESSQSHLYTV